MHGRKRLVAAATVALAAACATAPEPQAEELTDAQRAAEAERNDPFITMISAERYSILISLAREGSIEAPPAMALVEATELERAHKATLYAAHEIYQLRARVCETGLVGPDACGPLPPPAWMGDAVGAVPDVAEINRRIDWLTSVMWPFVEAGCDAGRSRQGPDEPDYCAVE
jgi:hypothetical protein